MKYKDLVTKIHPKTKDLRESYIQGDLFKVGDLVNTAEGQAEIINLGTNYLTLVAEGKTFKKWINEVTKLNEISKETLIKYMDKSINDPKRTTDKRKKGFDKAWDKAYAGGYLKFKGYQTKNFTEETVEFFKPILEHKDQFAVLNCIQAVDILLAEDTDFDTAAKNYGRAVKYFAKFDLDVSLVDSFKENLLERAILENKMFVSDNVVSTCTNILREIYCISEEDPRLVLEAAIGKLARNQGYTISEGWETLGTFAKLMRANGVSLEMHTKIKTLMGV